MVEGRTSRSLTGTASFVLASLSGLLLAGHALLAWVWSVTNFDPPGDEVAYGFGFIMMLVLAAAIGLVALGLGVAGALQRRRKRAFALLGVACSAMVLAIIIGQFDVAAFVASFSEPTPKVHIVTYGNE
jgi:hypothetical protein